MPAQAKTVEKMKKVMQVYFKQVRINILNLKTHLYRGCSKLILTKAIK